MNKKKCKKCGTLNRKSVHYCKTCGNNLSDSIEMTDILFFLSNIFKILSILAIIYFININGLIGMFGSLSHEKSFEFKILFLIGCLVLMLISACLKKEAIDICEDNIRYKKNYK